MIIFDSSYLSIQYNEELNAMAEEWKLDFTTLTQGDVFRKPLEQLLEEFKNRKITKWLSDNTEQQTLLSKDQLWLEKYFYPTLIQSGLTHAALVNAKNILGTGYAKNHLQNLKTEGLEVEVFNKNNIAQEWLKEI